jgi:uncharacterized protein (TIGR00375 family)
MTGRDERHPDAGTNAPLRRYYADLHVHIGRTKRGEPVKISGSRDLTFQGIAQEASDRKGMDIVGIIDCHSPAVQRDIDECLSSGEMEEVPGGGIRYRNTVLLLGAEIEVRDPGFGPAHLLVFLPTPDEMRGFTDWLRPRMTNVSLSSQRLYATARELQDEALARGGTLIPAHVFTPHRSVYGSCCDRMADLLDPDRIDAVELGLSADSRMAGYIPELDDKTFLSNSDAHSLAKIGREYNELLLAEPNFAEVGKALRGEGGRRVAANWGLDPRLGKYHRSSCAGCGSILDEGGPVTGRCPHCGHARLVRGVMDRILSLSDRSEPFVPAGRPPYRYQVPLDFLPGLGKRKLHRLLAEFGTEMDILHRVPRDALARAAGEELAGLIIAARRGELDLVSGGGGTYGKVIAGKS